MLAAGCDLHCVGQIGRHSIQDRRLAPGCHGSRAEQGQTVIVSCGDGDNVREIRRNIGLSGTVGTPGQHRPVLKENQAVARPRRDVHGIAQRTIDLCLATRIRSPAEDSVVGGEG
jgi:hypothetical protein